MTKEVARRMRKARESAGIKRHEMATWIGVGFDTIGVWERGENTGPPLWAVVAYARVLEVSLAELIGVETSEETLDRALLSILLRKLDESATDEQAVTISSLREQLGA